MNEIVPVDSNLAGAFELFDAAAPRFLATCKEATRRRYRVHLTRFRTLCEAEKHAPLGADALIAYNRHINDSSGYKNDTKRAYLKTIQRFFGWCHMFSLTPLAPGMITGGGLITMPEARRLSPRDLLSEDEARRLLHAARLFPADHCLITLMLNAGLRLSEALALRAADVYPAGGRYFVKVESGKGGKSREIPIPRATFETVASYVLTLGAVRLFEHYYPRKVQRVITKQARRAGIDKTIAPHSLRHTYANKLAELGLPIDLIGELLGHASVDTTRIYTRPGELLKRADLPRLPW